MLNNSATDSDSGTDRRANDEAKSELAKLSLGETSIREQINGYMLDVEKGLMGHKGATEWMVTLIESITKEVIGADSGEPYDEFTPLRTFQRERLAQLLGEK